MKMDNEFNEFRKNLEREANLIRALARERLEAKRTADKKGKDYTFSFNFPHNEEEYEAEKNNKPERIKKLEEKFIVSSDKVQDIANNISKGYLRKISYQNLVDMFKCLLTSEQDMCSLAQEYSELIGNEIFTHPNYDKYIKYSSFVIQALNDEIELRQEIMGDFEGKVFRE